MAALCPVPAAAQSVDGEHAHEGGVEIPLESLTVQQRRRLRRLFDNIICKCPRENWTRTLTGCPDGCADEQKQQVTAAVAAGRDDEDILAEQRRMYGPRVIAAPPFEGSGVWVYLLPFVVLGLGAVVVGVVLAGWKARKSGHGAEPAGEAGDREIAAVERELEELE